MLDIRLPAALVAADREFDAGLATPAPARDAATVVLLRDGGRAGVEVYLMTRQASMSFAAGMAVFPGGGVDPLDADADLVERGLWAGPSPSEWAERLGCEEDLARSLVCAAVRETFEECGVLLAGPSRDAVVGDLDTPEWEAVRRALESHERSLSSLLVERGLFLRTDLLGAWDAWLTPRTQPKRFRTWFFVARLPEGQSARDVSTEAAGVAWRSVGEVLDAASAGDLAMMPPTWFTCLDIEAHDDLDAVFASAARRRVEMFMPRVVALPDGHHTFSRPERLSRLPELRAARRKTAEASEAEL